MLSFISLGYFRGYDLGDHGSLGRSFHVFRRLKVHRIPRSSLLKERERERELSAEKAFRGRGKVVIDSPVERERSECNNTLDKCGSLSAPRTISAHALAYFKYDIPAILQYAAEFAAADI